MALRIIVSYDDTDNDRDALALGRLLAISGADLSLAYVRHSVGGALEQKEAEEMLARGAASVGAPEMARHVVVNAGTSIGLRELAESEGADVIVFGSEYRTSPGAVAPGRPAHKLLLDGPAAIAIAPAGLHSNPSVSINTVGILDSGDPSARETAQSLAGALGAERQRARLRPGRPAGRRLPPGGPPGQGRRSARPATTRSKPPTSPVLGRTRAASRSTSAPRRLRPRRPDARGSRPRSPDRGRRSVSAPRSMDDPAVVAGDDVGGDRLRDCRSRRRRRRASLGGGPRPGTRG